MFQSWQYVSLPFTMQCQFELVFPGKVYAAAPGLTSELGALHSKFYLGKAEYVFLLQNISRKKIYFLIRVLFSLRYSSIQDKTLKIPMFGTHANFSVTKQHLLLRKLIIPAKQEFMF